MKLTLILFIVLCIYSLKAQDTLFLKKNKIIICNITEIGIDEIKYKKIENEEGPVYVIRKSDVYKITFKNGISEFITPDEMDINKEEAILDKNQAIKVAFLSPIFDHIQIAYERKLKMTKNLELKFGFIGFGNENFNSYFKNLQGAYFAGGIKFLTGTDFYINGMKFVHPLKGTYLKPEFCVSVFDYSAEEWRYSGFNSPIYEIISYRASLFALNMILGKQYI